MKKIIFTLHAHMPYVLHDDKEFWLYEVCLHSYLPFLKMLTKHEQQGIKYTLSVNLSPILLIQLNDPYFQKGFLEYLRVRRENLTTKSKDSRKNLILEQDLNIFLELEEFYTKIDQNLIKSFQHFEKNNYLKIGTSAITHAFLPAMEQFPHLIHMNIALGAMVSRTFFTPSFFWSPECGTFRDLHHFVSDQSLYYIFSDPASSIISNQSFQQEQCSYLVRNLPATGRIWDAQNGYPCNGFYREFHKDLMQDDPYVALRCGAKKYDKSGVSLYAITDIHSNEKVLYDHQKAQQQTKNDAKDFSQFLIDSLEDEIVICFDMELFGHWWKEGVDFLDQLLSLPQASYQFSDTYPTNLEESEALFSTWGYHSNSDSWINNKTSHIWEQLIQRSFEEEYNLSQHFGNSKQIYFYLLAIASDWTFLITHQTSGEFSNYIINKHLNQSSQVYIDPFFIGKINEYLQK